MATVDDARRFKGAHQVEAYLGLVPSEMSSGEKQRRGHITKTGDSRMRALLVQVAVGMMRLKKASTRHLWEWAGRLEARRGKKVAAVALGRKLAGILFAMMRDETNFEPCQPREVGNAAVPTHELTPGCRFTEGKRKWEPKARRGVVGEGAACEAVAASVASDRGGPGRRPDGSCGQSGARAGCGLRRCGWCQGSSTSAR